jgi:signal transduction histidine kinase
VHQFQIGIRDRAWLVVDAAPAVQISGTTSLFTGLRGLISIGILSAWVHGLMMIAKSHRIGRILRSLSVQFLLAGGVVLLVGAYAVGTWVTDRIERGVVQNSGASAALYIESLLPNQTRGAEGSVSISEDAQLVLRQAFQEGILSERVVTYNIWSETGEVLESFRPEQRGLQYEPSEALLQAWAGDVVSQFQTLQAQAGHPEATVGVPLLEVYVPIRDANTGEVLTVVEFYQRAEPLVEELAKARRESWTLVARIFGLSGAFLFVIVHAGSRLIERQREQLRSQLLESHELSKNNDALRKRVSQAAQRATAQSEKIMQRIGQDLHDGVAQHLSLVSLRLEGAGLGSSKDAETIMQSLKNAMKELRGISRGLSLPDLATLDLSECAAQAVTEHNKAHEANAQFVDQSVGSVDVNDAIKLCVYRFLQESLSNAARHAIASSITVELNVEEDWIDVLVSDNGRGFTPDELPGVREDGGQGLLGLSDRAATLGGAFVITSHPGNGTQARLRLPIWENNA